MKRKSFLIILGVFLAAFLFGQTNQISTTSNAAANNIPVQNAKIHFNIIGNTRTSYDVYEKFVSMIMTNKPDFVINTGGVVNSYNNDNEWIKFKKYSKPIFDAVPYYCVASSREVFATEYYKTFHLKNKKAYFSFTNQNSLFLFLNSNNVRANDEQFKWLVNQLEAHKKYTFKFLVLNFPIYSSGELGGDIKLQILLKGIIEKYSIDMVISGNDSDYERLKDKKCTFIISGGGGVPVTPRGAKDSKSIVFKSIHHYCDVVIENNTLYFNAIDETGKVIDSFKIHKLQ